MSRRVRSCDLSGLVSLLIRQHSPVQCLRVAWISAPQYTYLLFKHGLNNRGVSHQDDPDCQTRRNTFRCFLTLRLCVQTSVLSNYHVAKQPERWGLEQITKYVQGIMIISWKPFILYEVARVFKPRKKVEPKFWSIAMLRFPSDKSCLWWAWNVRAWQWWRWAARQGVR